MDDQQTREAAADLIDGAIDVLHERGWCQEDYGTEDGRVCLVGALGEARQRRECGWLILNTDADVDVWQAATRELTAIADCACLEGYNDATSTTAEDVVLTMKRAAASLREVTS